MKVFDCSCGKKAIPAAQKGLHARSRLHIEWCEIHGTSGQTDYDLDSALPAELANVAEFGRADPVEAARAVRRWRRDNPFGSIGGHDTIREFLVAYDIPTIDVPRGVSRPEVDRFMSAERARLIREYAEASMA